MKKSIDIHRFKASDVLNSALIDVMLHDDSDGQVLELVFESGKNIEIYLHISGVIRVETD